MTIGPLSGMAIGAVEDMAHQLLHEEHTVDDVYSRARALIAESESIWTGSDADRFRSDWQAEQSLGAQIAHQLGEFARLLLINIEQQRQTSR